jgi:N,N'-diacetyllegionaminate synthase
MILKLGDKECGDHMPPLMFAEEGQANQGNFNLALKMINTAANVGADGIEFQLFFADDMYIREAPGHQIYLNAELSKEQVRELVLIAHKKDLLFQAACLSPRMVEICAEAGVDVFCVNATDLNNPDILAAVSSTKIPFWLATLMGTVEEIDWSVEYLNKNKATNFGLLHGQHVMTSDTCAGVPPEIAQLDCIEMFRQRYGLVTGYVDHTPTKQMPAIAAAKGAAIVMKHLAPEAGWRGPDWAVCLAPEDWMESQKLLRYSGMTSGKSKNLSQAEFKDRSLHRRSLYTTKALGPGQVITKEDLISLRPGQGGIDPRKNTTLIGKKVIRSLDFQHMLQLDDFED